MSDQSGNCTGQHLKWLENVRCLTVIPCAGMTVQLRLSICSIRDLNVDELWTLTNLSMFLPPVFYTNNSLVTLPNHHVRYNEVSKFNQFLRNSCHGNACHKQ